MPTTPEPIPTARDLKIGIAPDYDAIGFQFLFGDNKKRSVYLPPERLPKAILSLLAALVDPRLQLPKTKKKEQPATPRSVLALPVQRAYLGQEAFGESVTLSFDLPGMTLTFQLKPAAAEILAQLIPSAVEQARRTKSNLQKSH